MLQEALSVLLQVDAADGNKVVTVRAPLQVGETSLPGPVGGKELSNCVFFFFFLDKKSFLHAFRHHEILPNIKEPADCRRG